MNTKIEQMHYPLEKISIKNLEYYIQNDPLISLKNYTIFPVVASGEGEIIRDAFVEFSKNIPKNTYLVVDFQRCCKKTENGYNFLLTGNAILLNNN